MLDDVAVSALSVDNGIVFKRRLDAGLTTFSVLASPSGLPVILGHSHEVHLWLEVDGMWRVDTVDDELEALLDEWRDLIRLGQRVAGGLEAPSADVDEKTWLASNDYVLRRIGKDEPLHTLHDWLRRMGLPHP